MRRHCERSWQVDALHDGQLTLADVASFDRHRKVCPECDSRAQLGERLSSALPRLPDPAPTDFFLRRLRGRVLSDAATRTRATSMGRRWGTARLLVGVLGLVAVAVVGGNLFRDRLLSSGTSFMGLVTPSPDARWNQTRKGPMESVLLDQGELSIVVRKLQMGERFLVRLPDGELEVRGTAFEVIVQGGATQRVHVVEGRVVVRIRGWDDASVLAGGTWERQPPAVAAVGSDPSAPTVTTPTAPTPRPASAPQQAPPPRSRPHEASNEGADYEAAMSLYRSGRYREASEAFHRFAARYEGSGLLEDATFLEALSLEKSGKVEAAALAARQHLQSFPGSFHRKDASILVARAARDRGDCDAARRVLAPWLANPTDAVTGEALGNCAER
jgi:TolA-binding protein